MSDVTTHRHETLDTHRYWDGSTETDQPCHNPGCQGIGRIQMGWAPNTGMHWLKCCCCGDEWNPGPVIYPPGVGEFLSSNGFI